MDVRNDRNRRLAEVPVQREPNGVAFLPDGKKAYVANTVSGTVSVIKTNIKNGRDHGDQFEDDREDGDHGNHFKRCREDEESNRRHDESTIHEANKPH
jgi:DNA-binding beta-propeller fold protein YncE